MPRLKYNPPRKRGAGSVQIYAVPETVRLANEMAEKWPKRMEEGRGYVVLDAARIIAETVNRFDPNVNGLEYADNLRVAVVSGVQETDAVALFYKDSQRELDLSEEDDVNSVLFFATTKDSPAWVNVLRKYHPWPASMVPAKARKGQARVISRRVTKREIDRLTSSFYARRRSIERELRGAGLPDADISKPGANETMVVDDIAYLALRAEFGLIPGGKPHWRPALKEMQNELRGLGQKFVDYVISGKKSVFDLPDFESLSAGDLGEKEFQTKIIKASGL